MDTNIMIEELMNFGLTRQEATVYLALCRFGTMSGYEVAKQTGISRSNAYNTLAGLTDKGAAYVNNGATMKYTAVDVSEFCENKIKGLKKDKEHLIAHVPKEKEPCEGYLTISGDGHIRDKILHMFQETEKRIYVSMAAAGLKEFAQDFVTLKERGIKIVIITDCEISQEGIKLYPTEIEENQIGIITDSRNVLTGEYGLGTESTCLYSEAKNFVQVFKNLLSNQIKLIEISRGEELQ